MDIGLLKEIVTFKFNYPATLGAGFSDNYFDLLTTRGYLKKRTGQRSFESGEVLNKGTYELWIRYAAYLESYLRSDIKIVINSREYTIETYEKIDEQNFYFKFIINEKRD